MKEKEKGKRVAMRFPCFFQKSYKNFQKPLDNVTLAW